MAYVFRSFFQAINDVPVLEKIIINNDSVLLPSESISEQDILTQGI